MLYKHRILLFAFLAMCLQVTAAEKADSLLALLPGAPRDSACMDKLNHISKIYYSQSNYDKAIEYARQGLSLADSLHNKYGKAVSLNRLGSVYAEKGELTTALSYFFQSLRIREASGDQKGMSFAYNNIGNIYLSLDKNDYALLYMEKSLAIKEKLKDSLGISNSYMNIGNVYTKIRDSKNALSRYQKALEIRERLHMQTGMAALLLNMAELYSHDTLTLNKALDTYARSYALAEKASQKNIMATVLNNTALIYIKHNLPDKALINLKKSMELSKEIGALDQERDACQSFAYAYEKKGDFKSAFAYFTRYATIKDTLLNAESTRQFAEMTGRYEMEKKDKAISLLKKEGEIRDLTISRQGMMRNLLFVLLGLSLVTAFLLLNRFQVKKKANVLLHEQNTVIENKNLELEKLSIVASETINGVLIAGADGEIEWANQGFTKLLGYDIEEFKALKGTNLLKASANPEIGLLIQKSIQDKKSVSYEAINTNRAGKEIWLQSTITPILNKEGELRKLVVIDSDITELKKAEGLIRRKNRSITDSIEYARRIQQAMLPSAEDLQKYLGEHALMYLPKDIVSGDFFWLCGEEKGVHKRFVFAVADCTGHGVPGALMSMIGSDQLNRIVREEKQFSPAAVLMELNRSIKKAMQKTDPDSKDGMEIGICRIDTEKQELCFAGANRPMLYFRKTNGGFQLETVPYDRAAIGGDTPYDHQFAEHTFTYSEGAVIYLSSDGFSDQFGGSPRRKYTVAAFKDLLLRIQDQTMSQQGLELTENYSQWKGSQAQTDDVTLVGIKLK
jgi:PAS domain S-box-containing protein